MTGEEVLKLNEDAKAAQQAADVAKADAAANPTDTVKAATAEIADLNATKAWKAWKIAESNLPTVSPSDWRVILLGVYLALTLLISVYLLAVLAMALPPDKTIGDLRIKCCGVDDKSCPPTPTPTATPATTPADNTNTASGNTAAANTNQVNSNTATNPSTNQTPNGNLKPAENNPVNQSNSKVNKNPTANSNSEGFKQEIIEPTVPAIVCAEYFNRLSADGYLFLIVLFAGMVGAVTRGIFSFVRHHGVKDFSFSWTWFYLFLPFSGAVVSLFLYFIIRGGFYGSPVGKSLVLNLFAFVALGTLSGLFAENAMEKLREVAEVLLAKVPQKVENPNDTTNKK